MVFSCFRGWIIQVTCEVFMAGLDIEFQVRPDIPLALGRCQLSSRIQSC